MKNVIIFDIVGVLRNYDNDDFYKWLGKTFNIDKDIKAVWKKWQRLRDVDKIDEHIFYKNFLSDLGISQKEINDEEFYRKFYTDYVSDNYDILKFIEKNLHKKYELFLFTNASRIDIRDFAKKYDFRKIFKNCVCSYELKTRKPEAEFFQKGLAQIGHAGKECIFFDDQIKSKIPSEKQGIKFIQYLDFEKFIADLKSLELI